LTLFFFLVTASHGFLDAFTDGGLGIAFLAPFDDTRYFFPWRPIEVAPLGLTRMFTLDGWSVIRSELLWVWLPVAVLATMIIVIRNTVGSRATS
jgi:inner membrane protein